VQRLTVYHHFLNETNVFQVCTVHWLSLNPPPSPELRDGRTGDAAIAAAFAAFNGSYARTRRMWSASHRDFDHVPALQEPMRQYRGYGEGLADALASDRAPLVRTTLAHLPAFPTWESLEASGLDDGAKTRLGLAWIDGAERVDGA
jgi:hypothetical protein